MAMPTALETIPVLLDGDRLSVAEFERRYLASPHIKKAELIEGVVYVVPSVSDDHGGPHFDAVGWISPYRYATPQVTGSVDSTVRLDQKNRPQPDVLLRILPGHGGQMTRAEDGFLEGAPELAFEVSLSSASYDLKLKLEVYRRNNVREYVVWRIEDRAVFWFILRAGQYEPLGLSEDGFYKSEVFPGLWLDPKALVDRDMARVLAVGQLGLASPEHAAFVARFAQAQGGD